MLDAVLAGLEGELGPRRGEPVSLDGGITNRNLRVRFGDHDAVVRLPGKETDLLGIDREAERAATAAAAAVGVGPEVLAFLPQPRLPGHGFIGGEADGARAGARAAGARWPTRCARSTPARRCRRLRAWASSTAYARPPSERGGTIPDAFPGSRATRSEYARR